MKFNTAYSQVAIMATIVAITTHTSNAFSIQSVAANSRMKKSTSSSSTARTTPFQQLTSPSTSTLYMNTHSPEEQMVADDEISRLKIMAQKLRAEAAALEAERAQELANAASVAFEKFDVDNDGVITLEELKRGLEKTLKTELSTERVKMIMDEFDVSGDGKLQIDEMVTVDQFRNKLAFIVQEEKRLAKEAVIAAKQEEELAKLAEARMSILNDGEPTGRDKLLSILPYLFPLLDSLQFGRFLIVENADNPLVGLLALAYAAYRSIPFSGFVAFLALNVLSSNPGINRLVRFNMQQAIFLDIALFFPGFIAAILGVVGSSAGLSIPESFVELTNNTIFGALLLTVAYASISSFLGITPDKIPIISQAVDDRMPTVDMFDDQGRFLPREMRGENKNKTDGDQNDKKE
jgi:hypothetical protein